MNIEKMHAQKPKTMSGIAVGSSLCFSDTLLKIADGEMDCVRFARLEDLPELEKLGETADAEQRASVRNILVDETMLERFCTAVAQLKQAFPNARFAVAYRNEENACRLIALAAGCKDLRDVSLLPMTLEVDRWLSVLRLLVCGEHYVPAELLMPHRSAAFIFAPGTGAGQPDAARTSDRMQLTEREMQVLRSAAEGKPNKIIAEELQLSQHTIKLHMHHLMAKLGVHNRTEAAAWFFDHQHETAAPPQ